jgi:hypothetical protein
MTIPKFIHQTIANKQRIHPVFVKNIAILKELNPGWEYRLYDDEDIIEFIKSSYDREFMRAYERINPAYGPARADLFRYLLMHKLGGVYLDIKSTLTRKLDDVLNTSDEFILSRWPNKKGHRHYGWGRHRELGAEEEFQQWHIVATPKHCFLEAVIQRVMRNIESYNPVRDGIGRLGIVRVTGPVAYTLGILSVKDRCNYRIVDIEDLGFIYSFLETSEDTHAHKSFFEKHGYLSKEPIVAPNYIDKFGQLGPQWEPMGRNKDCPCGSGKRYKRCHGMLA